MKFHESAPWHVSFVWSCELLNDFSQGVTDRSTSLDFLGWFFSLCNRSVQVTGFPFCIGAISFHCHLHIFSSSYFMVYKTWKSPLYSISNWTRLAYHDLDKIDPSLQFLKNAPAATKNKDSRRVSFISAFHEKYLSLTNSQFIFHQHVCNSSETFTLLRSHFQKLW